MKIITFFLILLMVSPIRLTGNAPDSVLMVERDYYYKAYRSVRDTMTINTWLNLKRLSDNLEQVVERDRKIIEHYLSKASSDSLLPQNNAAELKARALLEMEMNQLEARTINDMRMLWILKTAAGLMLLVILLLLYLLINEKSKLSRFRSLYAFADKLAVEKRNEITMLESELEKLRQREQDFRAELEKGIITHQEKLIVLQKKNIQLENDLKRIKDHQSEKREIDLLTIDSKADIVKFPDNEKEVKELIQSLSDERNSLMNLAGRLQKQIETEKERYQDLVQKIKSITGINPDQGVGDNL